MLSHRHLVCWLHLARFLIVAGALAGAVHSGAARELAAPRLQVQTHADALEIDNGWLRLELVRTQGVLQQNFSALNAAGKWELVCSAFHPDFQAHPGGNPLFDRTITSHRYLAQDLAAPVWNLVTRQPDRVVVRIAGKNGDATLAETIELRRGERFFHISQTATLPTKTLDYCLSSFVFSRPGAPEFVHSPTAKKDETRFGVKDAASDQVLGDIAFHAPAIVLQDGPVFAALVPDLEVVNRDKVLSPDARRRQSVGATKFDTTPDPSRYSMPTALDLNLRSGLTDHAVFSYGLMDFVVSHHMHYQRTNDASMVRTLATNRVSYAFDLFVGAREQPFAAFQQVSRHLWTRHGKLLFQRRPHLALPFEEYVKLVEEVAFRPMPTDVQPPVPGYEDHGVFLEFLMDGQLVGSLVAPLGVLGFGDALWNFEFWNPVRDASGLYYWGQKLQQPKLVECARRIIQLALLAPRHEQGLFCLTYLAQSKRWLRGCVSVSAHTLFSKNDDTYDVPAMSKTGAHLLEYYQQCEPDGRVIDYLTPYAQWLTRTVDAKGRLPAYFTPALQPNDPFPIAAQSGASMWFLAEMYAMTKQPPYLAAAQRIAGYLRREVIPRQLWMDLEPYFSCGQNPLSFTVDPIQGLPVRGNLSTLWAAEGFAALHRVTGSTEDLRTGEQVLDYLAFSQTCWDFHYTYTAFPFGGFTSDNVDTAAELDARQAETVRVFSYYGEALGRQDLWERAVAAARSGAVLINHPLHRTNGIYAHPNLYGLGLGPENINHEGHNQSAMRTHPSWGECSAVFTGLANADRLLQGARVDAGRQFGVGANGLWCTDVRRRGAEVSFTLRSQLAAQPSPWRGTYTTTVLVEGLPKQRRSWVRINDLTPVRVDGTDRMMIPVKVYGDGRIELAEPKR